MNNDQRIESYKNITDGIARFLLRNPELLAEAKTVLRGNIFANAVQADEFVVRLYEEMDVLNWVDGYEYLEREFMDCVLKAVEKINRGWNGESEEQ